jgi:hypothetical protein
MLYSVVVNLIALMLYFLFWFVLPAVAVGLVLFTVVRVGMSAWRWARSSSP